MEPKNGSGTSPPEQPAPSQKDAEGDEAASPPDPPEIPKRPLAKAPPQAEDLAELCVKAVERAIGVKLDYTPETLSLLDHYVTAAAAGEAGKGKAEALDLVARTVGAYFGELLRRRFSCWWHVTGDDLSGWHLRFEDVFLMVSPYALALTALGLLEADDMMEAGIVIEEEELDDIAAHLALHPPIPEEEFVLPSTRFDVLEIVVDQLKARAHQRGLGDVTFDDADYDG